MRREPFVELHSRHIRHHQIAEDHVERRVVPQDDSSRLRRVRGDDLVVSAQHAHHHRSYRLLVVHHEDAAACARGRGCLGGGMTGRRRRHSVLDGKRTVKRVPTPSSLSTVIPPPNSATMLWQMARPSPETYPDGLVVKKGSKTRRRASFVMPPPLSLTSANTLSPSHQLRTWISPCCWLASPMACAALISRLRKT